MQTGSSAVDTIYSVSLCCNKKKKQEPEVPQKNSFVQ